MSPHHYFINKIRYSERLLITFDSRGRVPGVSVKLDTSG